MNESNRSKAHLVHRTRNQATSSASVPIIDRSISPHLISMENEAIDCDNDTICTFALRLPQCQRDHLVPNSNKQERRTKFDQLSKIVKSPLSEIADRQNDTELWKTYDSPAKMSKKSMASITNQSDITVNFTLLVSSQSPRSVIMNEICSHNTTLDDQNIEDIIFGSTNVPFDDDERLEGNDAMAFSNRKHLNHRFADSTTKNKNDENTVQTDDTFISSYNVSSDDNEGLVWQKLLNDFRSVQTYHWKGVAKLHDRDEYLKKYDDVDADDLIIHSKEATDFKFKSPSNLAVESSRRFDGVVSTGIVSKNHQTFNTRFPSNILPSRYNISNDALTISTHAESSMYSVASSTKDDNCIQQHDISVVDTRPICCTIVRRLSILLIKNEKRWSMDKEIDSLFPNYLSCHITHEHDGPSSRKNSDNGHVIRRISQKQYCFWRLRLRYRHAKQRLKTLL